MIAEYVTTEELERTCSKLEDEKLNDAYQKVRKQDSRLFVREFRFGRKRFNWRNPFKPIEEVKTVYEIKIDLGGQAEILHFTDRNSKSLYGFTTTVSKEMLETFLWGYLYGISVCIEQYELAPPNKFRAMYKEETK